MAGKSKSVYVRRRIFVVLGLVAVALAAILIVLQPGSSGPQDVKKVEVPSDLAATPSGSGEVVDTPACGAGQLKVTPVTNQTTYGGGEEPEFSLTVENVSDGTCIADLGTANMTFTVSSGSDQVWRSTDCQKGPQSLPVILDAGETLESDALVWNRTRSSEETCEIDRDPVVGGGASYHLQASAAGAESSNTAQFLLY